MVAPQPDYSLTLHSHPSMLAARPSPHPGLYPGLILTCPPPQEVAEGDAEAALARAVGLIERHDALNGMIESMEADFVAKHEQLVAVRSAAEAELGAGDGEQALLGSLDAQLGSVRTSYNESEPSPGGAAATARAAPDEDKIDVVCVAWT